MAAEDEDADRDRDRKVYSTFIRMAFTPYAIHFKSPNYMREETLHRVDERIVKETLRLTSAKAYIRNAIGNDPLFWEEISAMIRSAITSLERRCFQQWDPSAVDYETVSSTLIASASRGLTKDLDRLNDMVAVVRNILTAGYKVQEMCADSGFDRHMLKLINCCVRVTARGYDGEAGSGDEEKWQMVVNAYKKLLITSLQFLNNLCARNEKRKTLLWMALFDTGEQLNVDHETDMHFFTSKLYRTAMEATKLKQGDVPNPTASESDESRPWTAEEEAARMRDPELLCYDVGREILFPNQTEGAPSQESLHHETFLQAEAMLPFALFRKYALDLNAKGAKIVQGLDQRQSFEKCASMWSTLTAAEKRVWKDRASAAIFDVLRRASVEQAAARVLDTTISNDTVFRITQIERQLYHDLRATFDSRYEVRNGEGIPEAREIRLRANVTDAHTMRTSAKDAGEILSDSKTDLTQRLAAAYASSQQALPQKPAKAEPEEPSPQDVSDREDDYHESTEDGRGLLTDVPLILGPSEIEILPNMIMSGLVMNIPPETNEEDKQKLINMHILRSHLLLAQENGQNLLRELLIFVAAWDLREEELYFKFMVEIISSLLANGLIPYAYHCFRDSSQSRSKDIISPAQAVIMKLLTNIFRWRAELYKNTLLEGGKPPPLGAASVQVVNFLFTEFRRKIVPNTCALIYFQGRIHDNIAPPEDFPLNLWDMERMYEGVYQYLEFFAVLTEEQGWKDIMAKWEVAHELVTILQELEDAIPKLSPGPQHTTSPKVTPEGLKPLPQITDGKPVAGKINTNDQASSGAAPAAAGAGVKPPSSQYSAEKTAAMTDEYRAKQQKKMDEIRDAIAQMKKKNLPPEQKQSAEALADELSRLEVDTMKAPLPVTDPDMQLPYPEEAQDEPSDFEWRNLKKLTVLVLSSLIWKNKLVQDQVREFGGLEALVGCCRHDEHNPYIREHAIMCLRFAVEGNPENAAVIQKMADRFNTQLTGLKGGSMTLTDHAGKAMSVADAIAYADIAFAATSGQVNMQIPREVLDTSGYETFTDSKGPSGLRPKPALIDANSASHKQSVQTLKEAAAQAIQNAIAGTSGLADMIGKEKMTTKQAAERAAELMQTVLQDLPLPDGLDRDSREIIERLNRAALQSAQLIEMERDGALPR